MRLLLIPVGDGRDVIAQKLVFAGGIPTQILDRDPEVVTETDGIHDVPAAEAVLGWPSAGIGVLWLIQE